MATHHHAVRTLKVIEIDDRQDKRFPVSLTGLVAGESIERFAVRVTDISARGCCLHTEADVPIGTFLTVDMPGVGPVRGWVAWRKPERLGIEFDGAVPQHVIDDRADLG